MNHFIYVMKSTDPAPAAGGDTKSWFEHYKWDVDGIAFVPVPEGMLVDLESRPVDVLWFVMDNLVLGCAPIHACMPSLSGKIELHYDTRLIQEAGTPKLEYNNPTGRCGNDALFDEIKRTFDAMYPPRDQILADELGLGQSK